MIQNLIMVLLGLILQALNTARAGLAGTGTQTAALGFGGYIPPGNRFYCNNRILEWYLLGHQLIV
jgi:hypothetical protein